MLNEYLERTNAITIAFTCIVVLFWLFLFILMVYTLYHILRKGRDLSARVKIFTALSTISFQVYIAIIIGCMLLYQHKMMQKYTFSVALSYVFLSVGKQFMYLLFLQTLIKTFKRSLYQISPHIHKCVISLIIINFILYLFIGYIWIRQSLRFYLYLVTFVTVPIEMFYSLFIIALFGRKLFTVNLARINEQNTKSYEKQVRRATVNLVKAHKTQLKLARSISSDMMLVEEDERVNVDANRSMSQIDKTHDTHLQMQADASLKLAQTPSLRQPKSINIHRFNKENKMLLDSYQLSIIDTAAKYTVLSSVAFLTSLISTAYIGIAEMLYSVNQIEINNMDFAFMMLFVSGFCAIIGDICVLLRYETPVITTIYRALCYCPSVCCRHCFLYCSIRRVMITVEDALAEKIEEECETELGIQPSQSESSLRIKRLEKVSSLSTKCITVPTHRQIASSSNNTPITPYTPDHRGGGTAAYSFDESKRGAQERPRLNITVTSPDKKDVELVFDQKDDHEESSSFDADMKDFVILATEPRSTEAAAVTPPSATPSASSEENGK